MLTPSGTWRVAWSVTLLALSTLDVLLCTVALAYCHQPAEHALVWVAHAMFLVDMALTFGSAYLTAGGAMELRPRAIAVHYLRTTFAVRAARAAAAISNPISSP